MPTCRANDSRGASAAVGSDLNVTAQLIKQYRP